MSNQPEALSESKTAQRWIAQFDDGDREDAASLVDRLELFNEGQVTDAITRQLEEIDTAQGRVALYAEREISQATAFPIETYSNPHGNLSERAVAHAKFKPVSPRRGATRVGSEGWMAFLISQAIKANPRFVNHPAPRQYNSAKRTNRIRQIVIVTDFIGSGDRIWTMLHKFWRVPTFAAWWSRGYIRFHVVAAVGTSGGVARIKSHPCRPTVCVANVVSTLTGPQPKPWAEKWLRLAKRYGKDHDQPLGHKETAALVAFDYGMPNNVPAVLGQQFKRWKPLFSGRAPSDLRSFFGLPQTTADLLRSSIENQWAKLKRVLDFRSRRRDRAEMLAFLLALRGRWHADAEVEVAERSGLPTQDVLRLRGVAMSAGWISESSRLTDSGRKLLKAGLARRRREVNKVAGSNAPYYPTSLRVS
ncbi:phosphoribosyltransferase-like protein [Parerythrobacter aestuarii]|uniref:phosphoribosyltransferase-like protein n=1 Tax=Parerythrobacter aestuarii TaxID=3020909 RepID=UPI0024DE003F|nr:hypothetical protein [Parerythrobacter aestuarii]